MFYSLKYMNYFFCGGEKKPESFDPGFSEFYEIPAFAGMTMQLLALN